YTIARTGVPGVLLAHQEAQRTPSVASPAKSNPRSSRNRSCKVQSQSKKEQM
ncbi:hypothetical protein HAX54_049406, partial [Datura stramonium]|nr:hypothetical protein [Datura stramonium]